MYTKIKDGVWLSLKRKKLSDDGKLLFIYLFSCSHRTMIGLFHIPMAYVSADLDWPMRKVTDTFQELLKAGLIMVDNDTETVLIPGFLEHNGFDNPNIEKKAAALFEESPEIHETPLLRAFLTVLDTLPKRCPNLAETVRQTYAKQEKEKETEEEEEESLVLGATNLPETIPESPNDQPKETDVTSALIDITLNDKSAYPITEKQVAYYHGLYPAVNILGELRKMKGWCDANPAKRKTKKGIERFITNWLAREQDKGHRPQTTYQPAAKKGSNVGNFKQRQYSDEFFKQFEEDPRFILPNKEEKT